MNASILAATPQQDVEKLDLHHAAAFLDDVSGDERFAFGAATWLRAWEAGFLRGRDWKGPVNVYATCGANGLAGFLALAEQRVKNVPVKALAGYYWPFRTVCVATDIESRERFANAIAEHFLQRPPSTVLRFGPICDSDDGVRALLGALRRAGWSSLGKRVGVVAKLILPTTVDELRSSVSPSLLKNIDYRRRRIVMNEGQLEPERHMLEGNCGAILRELQIIERASWQGMKGAPKFVGVAQERFWRAIAQAQPVAARPVAWLLRCAGRPIAYQVHIETRDIIYKIGSCYDLEWKAYSPGSLLTYEIFSDACRRGKRHIDWGRGDSGYKSTWGANCEDDYLEEALLFRPGMLGRTALRLAQRALPDWTLASDC